VAFSILTLVGVLAIQEVILLTPGLTGGAGTLIGVPSFPNTSVFGVNLVSERGQYWIIAVICVVVLMATYRLERAGFVRTLRAIAQHGELAEALGVDTKRMRAAAFVFAAFFTGLVGAFSAFYLQLAHPSVWGLFPSIYIVAYAIVGGGRSVVGPVLGAAALIVGSAASSSISVVSENSLLPIVVGVGLIVVVLALPGGLVSIGPLGRDLLWRRTLRGRQAAVETRATET
jgi:branched-chain amino acid transport system permease protein